MIDKVEVVDPYKVNVIAKYPTLLHQLSLAYGGFQYPRKYFCRSRVGSFGKKPIGTGPYKYVEWSRTATWTHGERAVLGRSPAHQRRRVQDIPEGASKLAALEAGEVDFIIDVPLDAVERIERNPNLQLFSRPSLRLFYLTPSMLTETPLKKRWSDRRCGTPWT